MRRETVNLFNKGICGINIEQTIEKMCYKSRI